MGDPQRPQRPGAVDKESPSSGPLHNLQSELLAAKAAWEQLGARIAKGYTIAYRRHEDTLTEMKKAKEAAMSNDGLLFVLHIVSVGFAGGLVGVLVAPWVQKAGEMVAQKVFRASVVAGVAQQAAKDIADAGAKKMLSVTAGAGDPYAPVSPKELLVDQDIRDRIASAFGPILEALDAMIAKANAIQASVEAGQAILNNFRNNCRLMSEKPAQADIPTEENAARAAELAMWVAWTNERDWPWWNEIYKQLDSDKWVGGKGHDYVKEKVLEMDPVGRRLLALNKWADTYSLKKFWPTAMKKWQEELEELDKLDKDVPVRSQRERDERDRRRRLAERELAVLWEESVLYTDLRKLRALRLDDPNLPFRKLSGLSLQWDKMQPLQQMKFLSNNQDVKPAYK